jgi:Flp pilus assembly protein TadD
MSLGGLDLLIASALAVITFLLFAHAAKNDFIFGDDWAYVAANPDVQAGLTAHSLRWALTTFHAANWHPLTWISLQADWQLFGGNPVGFHLVNAGIHAINTSLVFVLLLLPTSRRWPSALCAALFGWHPLRVESVAWIAERKDVLSVFFFLLTLLAYLRYSRHPALKAYCLVVLLLAVGLLAKPMLVTAPLLLLLLDYWPLKRLRDAASLRLLVVEKIPLLFLSIASAIITIVVQHSSGALVPLSGKLTVYPRLNNSACSVVAYIAKLLVPINLAAYYPFPTHQSAWHFVGALLLLTLITLLCILARWDRPYLLVGWLWFIASLLPVVGLLQVGAQSMADRYSYIPSIGLLIAIVWLAADWYDRQKSVRPFLLSIGVCATIALVPMTYRQIGLWKDDLTLFTYTCSVTEGNWLCEGILANVLARQGDLEDAESHIFKALRILPAYPSNVKTLRWIQRLRLQRLPGEAEYAREIRANPSDPLPHYNWGNLLLRDGHIGDAIIHYVIYLDARPDDHQAHNNLGIALAMGGDLPAAEEEFDKAIQLDPTFVDAQYGLGTVLLRQGKYSEAATRFGRALQLDPGMRKAQVGLDQCRSQLGFAPTGS